MVTAEGEGEDLSTNQPIITVTMVELVKQAKWFSFIL